MLQGLECMHVSDSFLTYCCKHGSKEGYTPDYIITSLQIDIGHKNVVGLYIH